MTKRNEYAFENLNATHKECLSLVESLGIYELRALARVFGGNSPTTLKRSDLIAAVMEKIISGQEIRPLPLRQGRPHKELNNIDGILEELAKITGVDYTMKSGKTQAKKQITFNQVEEKIFSQNLFPIKAKGIVLQNDDGSFYFLNQYNNRYVLIKDSLCKNLCEFDFIEGEAVVMNAEKEYILNKITNVNHIAQKDYNGKAKKVKNGQFAYGSKSYPIGSRYRFENLTKFENNAKDIKKLTESLRNSGVATLAILPNVTDESMMDVQSLGFDNLLAFSMTENAEEIYQNIIYAIEYVRRQMEIGGVVAIFVQDPVTLANLIDYCFKNNAKGFMGHTDNVAELAREISSLITGQNTIFSTSDQVDLFDPLFVSLIYKNYKAI